MKNSTVTLLTKPYEEAVEEIYTKIGKVVDKKHDKSIDAKLLRGTVLYVIVEKSSDPNPLTATAIKREQTEATRRLYDLSGCEEESISMYASGLQRGLPGFIGWRRVDKEGSPGTTTAYYLYGDVTVGFKKKYDVDLTKLFMDEILRILSGYQSK